MYDFKNVSVFFECNLMEFNGDACSKFNKFWKKIDIFMIFRCQFPFNKMGTDWKR